MKNFSEYSQIKFPLLMSRFLTRSGDQAWDFAVPITLLTLFPMQISVTSIYYLFVRTAQVFLTPHLTSFIDKLDRLNIIKIGIGLQSICILFEFLAILTFLHILPQKIFIWNVTNLSVYMILIISGIGSSLGATFMNIAVANDIVPTLFERVELAQFNGRLKQIDLFTEVASPLVAGLLLTIRTTNLPLLGFSMIIIWNILSFIPEYRLLLKVFQLRPDLLKVKLQTLEVKKTFFRKIIGDWKSFFQQPVAAACVCYALLWLSVLSPHGVLLTAFLKGGWKLSEPLIGLFRGGGALFGLVSTWLFPIILKKMGLLNSSRIFIQLQSLMVIFALVSFYFEFKIYFLIFILLSRIGLYGFSLGEMQIRQEGITEKERGEINGFASALTSMATIFLYASGAFLNSIENFYILINFSVAVVGLSAIIFTTWSYRPYKKVYL